MSKQEVIQAEAEKQAPKGLALLRLPFPSNAISKLPKATKHQNEEVKNDFKKGIRCDVCGGWHHPKVVHLDYVGHAALTDRLLECDDTWNWEPVATEESGVPALDKNGGMWIRLTVCGMTRLGYGHADGKQGGDAIKEVIGDALRNAAMRFGAALDLWHKGDLHGTADDDAASVADDEPKFDPQASADRIKTMIGKRKTHDDMGALWKSEKAALDELPDAIYADVKTFLLAAIDKLAPPANADLDGDAIPYEGAST